MFFVISIYAVLVVLMWIAAVLFTITTKIKDGYANVLLDEKEKGEAEKTSEDAIKDMIAVDRHIALRKITTRAAVMLVALAILLILFGLTQGAFRDNSQGQIILFAAALFVLSAAYLAGFNFMLASTIKYRVKSK